MVHNFTYRLLAIILTVVMVALAGTPVASAAKPRSMAKILFIPHDSRPISSKQTAEVVKEAGYEIIMPPEELLGHRDEWGNPELLLAWLERNSINVQAAVISTDALLYGSLVGSRKHSFSEQEINARIKRLATFLKANPRLPVFAFGSIMRTPRTAEASGHEEPEYYRRYGSDIFRYTVLRDKEEVEGLNRREKKEYEFLRKLIPEEALNDWMGRRAKNYNASMALIQLTRDNAFHYFVLGRDDNAPYSQTHLESRHLQASGDDLGKTRFQTMAGIDEMGMLMLTRAVNELKKEIPFVFVRYNWGRGEDTIPAYSDEKIGASVSSAILGRNYQKS